MTKKRYHLAAMALCAAVALSCICAGPGRAGAYLTSRAGTSGYVYLDAGTPRTDLDDYVANWEKRISMTNTGTADCRVRARVLVPEKYAGYVTYSGTDWTLSDDGYWYYGKDLAPGAATSVLTAKLDQAKFSADFTEEGALDFSVIVVHEYARVQDGETVDWNEKVVIDD